MSIDEHERSGLFSAEGRTLARLIDELAEGNHHLQAQLDDLRELVADLAVQEQVRFGEELHQGLGQEVSGLYMLAQSLQRRLEERGAPESEAAARLTEGLDAARVGGELRIEERDGGGTVVRCRVPEERI